MKKMNQKLLTSVFAASALAVSAFVPVAHAEVSASVGASNMYYWRGYDLGLGDAAVWGDLNVSSEAGLYAGLWTSSGDAAFGTEYDLYFGWGGEFGPVGVDISYWSYNYPTLQNADGDSIAPFDFAEVVLGLSFNAFSFTYYVNVAPGADFGGPGVDFGSEDYTYFTLAADIGAFNIKYGQHDDVEGSIFDGYSHLDLTYNYNDNLSFTMGNVIDDVDGANADEIKFLVSFSIPIDTE